MLAANQFSLVLVAAAPLLFSTLWPDATPVLVLPTLTTSPNHPSNSPLTALTTHKHKYVSHAQSRSFSLILLLFPVQYEGEWSPPSPARYRSRSTYTAARSESPSIYSRRFDDSPRASFDDFPVPHTRPSSEATQRNQDPYGSEGETGDAVDESSDTRLSLMGPTTRVYSRAPWEVAEDNILREEDESYGETRSILSVRSRSKKREDKDSSSLPKGRRFVPPSAPRSSSVPRPSTDTQGFSSSTSSNYSRPSFSTNLRPESSASKSEFPWAANTADGHHHQDRSPFSSPPRSLQNDRSSTDPEFRRVHPYANPDNLSQALIHQPHSQHEQVDDEYIMVSPGLSGGFAGPNHKQSYHPTNGTGSPRQYPLPLSHAVTPLASPREGLPPKMAPWQHTPSSPTFRLLSLEEAQARRSKQRTTPMGTSSLASSSPQIRGRTVSGSTAQERLKSHTLAQETDLEDISKSATPNLKTRRSLLGLFAKKEKDRPVTPRTASPPPPVPSLPSSVPGTLSGLAPQLTSSAAPKSPRRVPPPSLNSAEYSPVTESNAKENTNSSPLASPNHPPTSHSPSVPSPPPIVMAPQPRKKVSLLGHGSRAPLAKPPSINRNPGSTSPSIAFPALQVRPVSTILSSLPSDYLSGNASPPPVPAFPFRTTADSPSTPGFSSRSASISTGSSDVGPRTPSVDHSANTAVLSQLRDQVNSAREVWKSQIGDLEAQVRALKKEIDELKVAPCVACGHVACANGEAKTSMLNRPRARTATGGRTLFGGDD